MMRYAFIGFAILGAGFFLPRVFPALAAAAFTVGGFGITWLVLTCLVVGYAGLKITK